MIRRLTLSNFKCYEKETPVSFSKINIFYGKNGRGKSTILQSLFLLSQTLRYNTGLETLLLNGDMVSLGVYDDIVNRSNTESKIKFIIESDEEAPVRIEFEPYDLKPTLAKLNDLQVGEQHYIVELSEAVSPLTSLANINKLKTFLPQSDIKIYSLLRSLGYVSANRKGGNNYETRRDDLSSDNIDVDGSLIINKLSDQTADFRETFAQELSLILSGASVRVSENPETPDRIDLFLDSRDGNPQGFKPVNVGFGYSYVLPIIYQVMTAPRGGIVAIENPEAHLYPGAQSRIMDFIVKYSVRNDLQVILETHSDHVINGLRLAIKRNEIHREDASITFFDRTNDDGSPLIEQIFIDDNGTLSKEPQDFMDEWTRQMLELL